MKSRSELAGSACSLPNTWLRVTRFAFDSDSIETVFLLWDGRGTGGAAIEDAGWDDVPAGTTTAGAAADAVRLLLKALVFVIEFVAARMSLASMESE